LDLAEKATLILKVGITLISNKMKNNIFKMIMIVFVFASCQEELEFENTETAQTPPNVLEQKKIQNGRFVFSSVSALEETIEELQKYDSKSISSFKSQCEI
tara:strand:- start:105 stop:407 length:303 start_codon:yes stop_codon:yes gene_type:complete